MSRYSLRRPLTSCRTPQEHPQIGLLEAALMLCVFIAQISLKSQRQLAYCKCTQALVRLNIFLTGQETEYLDDIVVAAKYMQASAVAEVLVLGCRREDGCDVWSKQKAPSCSVVLTLQRRVMWPQKHMAQSHSRHPSSYPLVEGPPPAYIPQRIHETNGDDAGIGACTSKSGVLSARLPTRGGVDYLQGDKCCHAALLQDLL